MARARGVHLTRRDLAILEELATRRVDTIDALHARHFAGLTRKRARNRLGELAAAGYLSRQELPQPDRAPLSVYTLGRSAPAALRLRSLGGEHFRGRRFTPALRETSIPHQLAVNRVGDVLRTALIPEHLLEVGGRDDRQHRPDAAYRAAAADERGRDLVLVEVDLGHYTRSRILAKVQTFLEHREARSTLFVTTTSERAELIARWIRDAHGAAVMERIQLCTLDELEHGHPLDPGTEPAEPNAPTTTTTNGRRP